MGKTYRRRVRLPTMANFGDDYVKRINSFRNGGAENTRIAKRRKRIAKQTDSLRIAKRKSRRVSRKARSTSSSVGATYRAKNKLVRRNTNQRKHARKRRVSSRSLTEKHVTGTVNSLSQQETRHMRKSRRKSRAARGRKRD